MELSRCAHRFTSSTLRMPALAGDGQVLMATIPQYSLQYLLSFAARQLHPRTSAFVGFLLGHTHLPAFSVPPPLIRMQSLLKNGEF